MKALFSKHKGRFSRFALVGLSGVVVNMGLLFGLTELAGIFYLLSSVIAIEASIISNFILNELWTFSDLTNKHRGIPRRMVKFNLVSLAGMVINLAVLFTLTSFFGAHYMVSNLFGIGAATLWNYFVNLKWTWGKI